MSKAVPLMRLGAGIFVSCLAAHSQQSRAQTTQDMLAAQIRLQGYACEKTVGAKRDAKLSRPDYEVWVLKCSNAVYRVSRYPDMAAQVVPLR